MKTSLFRNTSWFLVLTFCLTQIAPAGLAATAPMDELQARSVPASVAALTNPPPAPTQSAAAPAPAPLQNSTDFLVNGSPLSPATPEHTQSTVVPAPATPDEEGKSAEMKPAVVPPIVKDETPPVVNPPANTRVVTDPATGKEILVTIDEHGVATVKWGEETHQGYFDSRTNSVIILTKEHTVWTFKFGAKADENLYLQSFQSRQMTNLWEDYSEETYTFNEQGQLTRKDWIKQTLTIDGICFVPGPCPLNHWDFSGGTIDYVTIGGKTLVGHEKTWSESNGIYYIGPLVSTPTPNDPTQIGLPSFRSETEAWYRYDSQGNLLSKVWNTNNSSGSSSFGQEQYVHINGKNLVSVRRTWQYNGGMFSIDPLPFIEKISDDRLAFPLSWEMTRHSETYYNYDSDGNMLAEVNAWDSYDSNNVRHTGGSYRLRDAAKNTWTYAFTNEGIDNSAVHSWQDYGIIDAAAQRKTVYVGGNGERYPYTHRVEYTRNADGSMTAKAVYDSAGNVFIVRGEPDILSGGSDDIKLKDGQLVNGRRVTYREYWHWDANTNRSVNDGYRLIFYDFKNNMWMWDSAVAVDFPAKDAVTLNDVEYKITIDQEGVLHLEETIPPEVRQARAVLFQDMIKTFGFSKETLDQLIKDGKIVIQVDVKSLTATVTIDPSVTLPAGAVNLTDPLGNRGLPVKIHYQLGHWEGTKEGELGFYLISGLCLFSLGISRDNSALALVYYPSENPMMGRPAMAQDGNLKEVKIYGPAPNDGVELYATITYTYPPGSFATSVTLSIAYTRAQAGSRNVVLVQMQDGQYHIQSVTDLDKDGKVIAKSDFQYTSPMLMPCAPENRDCRVPFIAVFLHSITRTDANGNQLSVISIGSGSAAIALSDGRTKEVKYSSLEELLNLARQFESEIRPPAVSAYLDLLKKIFQGYQVNAKFVPSSLCPPNARCIWAGEPAHWLITVTKTDDATKESVGHLRELVVRLDGVWSTDKNQTSTASLSLQVVSARFNGIERVDAKLLFEGLKQLLPLSLPMSLSCPRGKDCGPLPVVDRVLAALRAMTQITVTQVDKAGAIYFARNGINYKTYRDTFGRVILIVVLRIVPRLQK